MVQKKKRMILMVDICGTHMIRDRHSFCEGRRTHLTMASAQQITHPSPFHHPSGCLHYQKVETIYHRMKSRRTSVLGVMLVALVLLAVSCASVCGMAIPQPPKKKYGGGYGIGRLVIDEEAGKEGGVQCHYVMILCERLQGTRADKNDSGDGSLYIPDEDLPRLHLCRVLSVGPGREEENGIIAPMPEFQVGDIIIAKNPWGIGPKDEETTTGMKLSYMRSNDIAAVITGGLVPEEAE